jgi:hypothetical protein
MNNDLRAEFRRHAARVLRNWESTYLSITELAAHYDRSFPGPSSYGVDVDEIAVSLARMLESLDRLDVDLRTAGGQVVERL